MMKSHQLGPFEVTCYAFFFCEPGLSEHGVIVIFGSEN